MQMIGILKKSISNAVSSCIQARPGSEVRMVLRGLPGNILDALLAAYAEAGGVQVAGHNPIRVLLVSDDAVNEEDSICGRCTGEDVVSSRNVRQAILILLPNGKHLNKSIESSVSYIGLDPETVNGKQGFSEDPFVDVLLAQLQEQLSAAPSDCDKIRRVLNYSFADRSMRGDVDRSTTALNECWALLGDLFETKRDLNQFLARCGLPSIKNGDLATKEHLELLGDLAKFIESNGFSSAKETLLREADESLHSHIIAFFASLSAKLCDSPPDFTLSPAYFYSQDNEPAQWWETLDLETWLTLLQSIKPPPEKGLQPICLNHITVHKVKGLPYVVQDAPCFRIVADGVSKPNEIKVFRGLGRNPKEEATIGADEEWTPDEVPVHGNSVYYRFVAGEGYKPAPVRVISLEEYEPGILFLC